MAYEQKEGFGALFQNNKTKDTQPDFTGDLMINGKLEKIAAWKKKTQKGDTYLSLSVDKQKEQEDVPF